MLDIQQVNCKWKKHLNKKQHLDTPVFYINMAHCVVKFENSMVQKKFGGILVRNRIMTSLCNMHMVKIPLIVVVFIRKVFNILDRLPINLTCLFKKSNARFL